MDKLEDKNNTHRHGPRPISSTGIISDPPYVGHYLQLPTAQWASCLVDIFFHSRQIFPFYVQQLSSYCSDGHHLSFQFAPPSMTIWLPHAVDLTALPSAQSRTPVSLDISPVYYFLSPGWPYFCVDLLLFSLSFPRWTLLYGIVILSFQLAALVLLFMTIHLPVQLAAPYPAGQYAVQYSPPFCSDACPCPAVENSPSFCSIGCQMICYSVRCSV